MRQETIETITLNFMSNILKDNFKFATYNVVNNQINIRELLQRMHNVTENTEIESENTILVSFRRDGKIIIYKPKNFSIEYINLI